MKVFARLWRAAVVAGFVLTSVIGTPASTMAAQAKDSPATAFVAALKKTANVSVYSSGYVINVSGDVPESYGVPENWDPSEPITLLEIQSRYNNDDVHFKLNGSMYAESGMFPEQGLETMFVDELTYIHGPAPMLGAPEARWYVGESYTPADTASDSHTSLSELARLDLSKLQKGADEKLDGGTCSVYVLESKKAALTMLYAMLGSGGDPSDTSAVIDPKLRFWVCGDGYLHRAKVTLDWDCTCDDVGETQAAYRPAKRLQGEIMTFDLDLHYAEFDGKIVITAPANAIPLQEPDYSSLQQSSGSLNATVYNGGNIRQEPNIRGRVLGQLHAGQIVALLEKTADGSWYKVTAPEATGWVSSSLLTIPAGVAAKVPVAGQGSAQKSGPSSGASLTASVYNGGNVRDTPNVRGKVLDQINAGERVLLLEKSKDGNWYKITNIRNISGWVHRSLLTVEPGVAAQVPVAP